MPTTNIGSLFKPVTTAVKEAAKDVQALVRTARHDIKRRNFDRRVSLTSVKAIRADVRGLPRDGMDEAEIALMNDVRGFLNRLTERRSPGAPQEDHASQARDLWKLLASAGERAKEKGLVTVHLLEQALKDATADLPSDQLRLVRVRAVELYGYLGSQRKKVGGEGDFSIRVRLKALGPLIDTCNDRIIAKGHRSVFLGPHARTREEKAIDKFIAAPLYGDTLVGPSRDLVQAIKAGATVDEVQALIGRLASGYKSFGDELLLRAVFDAFRDAFRNALPDQSQKGLIDEMGRRAVAILEMDESKAGREPYLHAWLMLKVHDAYYCAATGQEVKEQGSGKRTIEGATIPQPEPGIDERYWAYELAPSLSPTAEAKPAETREPSPEQVKRMIDRALSAIRHRDWPAAYRALKALSSLDWSSGAIGDAAARAFDEMALSGQDLSYAKRLMVAVKNRFYRDESQQELEDGADEGKWRQALRVSAGMSVLNAIHRKNARLHGKLDDVADEPEISDADIDKCLAVLNDETAGTRIDFVQPVNEPLRPLMRSDGKGKEPERPDLATAESGEEISVNQRAEPSNAKPPKTTVNPAPRAAKGRNSFKVDESSIPPEPTPVSAAPVTWQGGRTPRKDLEDLTERMVDAISGGRFQQALQDLYDLDRLDGIGAGDIAKAVSENLENRQVSLRNVARFDGLVHKLKVFMNSTRFASTGDMLNVWTNIKRGVEQFRAVKRADPPRGDIKKAKALVTRLADGDGRAAPMAPDHSTRKNWLLATATRSRSSDTPRRNAVRASGEAEAGAGTGARALQLGEPTKPPASG